MPTIARLGPYRVFFFSNEDLEPPHVHIERDEALAKFWLDPVDLVKRGSFPSRELNKLLKLVVEHQQEWLEEWREYHRNRTTAG